MSELVKRILWSTASFIAYIWLVAITYHQITVCDSSCFFWWEIPFFLTTMIIGMVILSLLARWCGLSQEVKK